MADQDAGASGNVEVRALGKIWSLRLSINEMIEIQRAAGRPDDPTEEVLTEALGNERLKNLEWIRAIFCIALKRHSPGITLETAGDIIAEIGFGRAGEVIGEALVWAMPPKEEAAAGGGPPRPSVGPTSS